MAEINEKLNIPDKIKVGFQKRGDTYTGKLSYVTYINKKGQLAKENHGKGGEIKKSLHLNLIMYQLKDLFSTKKLVDIQLVGIIDKHIVVFMTHEILNLKSILKIFYIFFKNVHQVKVKD